MDKLLTTKEAAERLGMASGTLENWRVNGIGPRYVKVGSRSIRYEASALDAWLALWRDGQSEGSTKEAGEETA